MSLLSVQGYNRDASTGNAKQVLGAGVRLVDKDGNQLTLPAGYVVSSVQLKWVNTSPAPSSGAGADGVQVQADSTVLAVASFSNLTNNNFVAKVGTGSINAPTLAANVNLPLNLNGVQIGVAPADLDDNGALFCCTIKMVPFPTFA
jgi:hypothetical protein